MASRKQSSGPSRNAAIPPRRSQAERRVASRTKLIEGAVKCLNKAGYAETSLRTIAEEAGLSLGAIHHQFPTKVDLMLAVVEEVSGGGGEPHTLDPRDKIYRGFTKLPVGSVDQFMGLFDVLWALHTRPPAMAKLEIMMAAHSDHVLATKLKPRLATLDKQRSDTVWMFAQNLGIQDREMVDLMVGLNSSAMRGLALEFLATGDAKRVARQYDLLKCQTRQLVEQLLKKANSTTKRLGAYAGRP